MSVSAPPLWSPGLGSGLPWQFASNVARKGSSRSEAVSTSIHRDSTFGLVAQRLVALPVDGSARAQWWKSLRSVCAMAMPCSRQAAITSSSRVRTAGLGDEGDAVSTGVVDVVAERDEPVADERHTAELVHPGVAFIRRERGRRFAVDGPGERLLLASRQVALDIAHAPVDPFLTPDAAGEVETEHVRGCRPRCQTFALAPASLVQSTRDCWPAPMPIIWPSRAKPTELDWVYFNVTSPSSRSRRAVGGEFAADHRVARSASRTSRLFRSWTSLTPKTSRDSSSGGAIVGIGLDDDERAAFLGRQASPVCRPRIPAPPRRR